MTTPKKPLVLAGLIGAIAVLATLCVLAANFEDVSAYPQNISAFRTAVTDQIALNCQASNNEDPTTYTIQTTNGFDQVQLSFSNSDGQNNILVIQDKAVYRWNNYFAQKGDYDPTFSDLTPFIHPTDEQGAPVPDSGIRIRCSAPSKNTFSIPNLNWQPLTPNPSESEQ